MATSSAGKPDSLDALRIERRPERKTHTGSADRLSFINLLFVIGLLVAGYIFYVRAGNRPLAVKTFVVSSAQSRQPGVLLTGTGYVVTQHKYIIVGTKILGQILDEPIEDGQRVKKGEVLARIDD